MYICLLFAIKLLLILLIKTHNQILYVAIYIKRSVVESCHHKWLRLLVNNLLLIFARSFQAEQDLIEYKYDGVLLPLTAYTMPKKLKVLL